MENMVEQHKQYTDTYNIYCDIMNDIRNVLKTQDRPVREIWSDMYFNGCDRGFDILYKSRDEYANCCLERSIWLYKKRGY